MRMYSASGRSRWPIVIGAAVVVVVAVAGGLAYANTRGDDTPTAISSSTSTPTSSPSSVPTGGTSGGGDNEDDAAPTGCLGGQDRDVDMLLTAQKQGVHSTYGAVEVATAFERWLWQYPSPSVADSNTVSSNVIASTATPAWKGIAAQYKAAGDNITQGVVTAGTPFHVSTTNGIWRVTEGSSADRITVELAVGYVVNGALSPTKVAGIGLVMVWENGSWHVESGTNIDQTKLANGGTRFTGGC